MQDPLSFIFGNNNDNYVLHESNKDELTENGDLRLFRLDLNLLLWGETFWFPLEIFLSLFLSLSVPRLLFSLQIFLSLSVPRLLFSLERETSWSELIFLQFLHLHEKNRMTTWLYVTEMRKRNDRMGFVVFMQGLREFSIWSKWRFYEMKLSILRILKN